MPKQELQLAIYFRDLVGGIDQIKWCTLILFTAMYRVALTCVDRVWSLNPQARAGEKQDQEGAVIRH